MTCPYRHADCTPADCKDGEREPQLDHTDHRGPVCHSRDFYCPRHGYSRCPQLGQPGH